MAGCEKRRLGSRDPSGLCSALTLSVTLRRAPAAAAAADASLGVRERLAGGVLASTPPLMREMVADTSRAVAAALVLLTGLSSASVRTSKRERGAEVDPPGVS